MLLCCSYPFLRTLWASWRKSTKLVPMRDRQNTATSTLLFGRGTCQESLEKSIGVTPSSQEPHPVKWTNPPQPLTLKVFTNSSEIPQKLWWKNVLRTYGTSGPTHCCWEIMAIVGDVSPWPATGSPLRWENSAPSPVSLLTRSSSPRAPLSKPSGKPVGRLVSPTLDISQAVTCSFTATKSNEWTLLGILWAMAASPQPKSATTRDEGLGNTKW